MDKAEDLAGAALRAATLNLDEEDLENASPVKN